MKKLFIAAILLWAAWAVAAPDPTPAPNPGGCPCSLHAATPTATPGSTPIPTPGPTGAPGATATPAGTNVGTNVPGCILQTTVPPAVATAQQMEKPPQWPKNLNGYRNNFECHSMFRSGKICQYIGTTCIYVDNY